MSLSNSVPCNCGLSNEEKAFLTRTRLKNIQRVKELEKENSELRMLCKDYSALLEDKWETKVVKQQV